MIQIRTFRCEMCGREFEKRISAIHRRTRHNTRPSFAVTCSKECSRLRIRLRNKRDKI
jgi:hypothetical protein